MQKLADAGISYGVVDALSDRHLATIGEAIASHALVTGGSGVALGLPGEFPPRRICWARRPRRSLPEVTGRAVVLAGSCSTATRGQIEHAAKLWPHRKLDPDRIAAGEPVAGEIDRLGARRSRPTRRC